MTATGYTLPEDVNGTPIQAPVWDWANGEKRAYTDTHGQTAAFTTDVVLITASTDCFIKFAANPTATDGSDSLLIPAFTPLVFGFIQGEKISAVRKSTSGDIYVVPRL